MNRPPSPSEGRRQKGRQSAGTGRRGDCEGAEGLPRTPRSNASPL